MNIFILPLFWEKTYTDKCRRFLMGRLSFSVRNSEQWPQTGKVTVILHPPWDSWDQCHTCSFIARFCRATLSRDKIASV